jgi:hypothetical protein
LPFGPPETGAAPRERTVVFCTGLAQDPAVPWRTARFVLVCVAAVLAVSGTTTARSADAPAWTSYDEAALRELLEGTRGYRHSWVAAPELLILDRVMRFEGTDVSRGAKATADQLDPHETLELEADLTSALLELTGGQFAGFSRVRVVTPDAAAPTAVFQRGRIVVGRFRGIHEQTGALGYGGRTTLAGTITAGVVMLDDEFDRASDRRRVVRMHELGHALGYNHVESRPSLMNPRIGRELTAFDRMAIGLAHGPDAAPAAPQLASLR